MERDAIGRTGMWAGAIGGLQMGSFARPTFAVEEFEYAGSYFVADLAHAFYRFAFWVFERPVIAFQSWHERALFAAAHRDQHLGLAGELVAQLLRFLRGQVDANFAHCFEDFGVDSVTRICASRDGVGFAGVGKGVEPSRGHLRTACVVNAGEDDGVH